jgi:hypothetical protein
MPLQVDFLPDDNRKKCRMGGCKENCIVEVQLTPLNHGRVRFEHYCAAHLVEFERSAWCEECGEAMFDHLKGVCPDMDAQEREVA